jgi:hypothetical protein
MGRTILTALGCIVGQTVVAKVIEIIEKKMPRSSTNRTILRIFGTATTACCYGYAGLQYASLGKSFSTLSGFANYAMSNYCNISCYLNMIGCVVFGGATIIASSVLYCERVFLNSPIFSQVITVLNMIGDELRNPAPTTPQTITETQLEGIAPLQCPGLHNSIQGENHVCSICQNNLTESQMGRTLPCNHMFHAVCIDQWLLQRSATCPMCRMTIIAT